MSLVKNITIGALLLGCVYLFTTLPKDQITAFVIDFLERVDSFGWYGPVIFGGLHIVMLAVCFPGTVLFEWGAGFLWGFQRGSLLIALSKPLGGALGFVLGRSLLRGYVQGLLGESPRVKKLQQNIASDGWKLALMVRLSPIPSWVGTYGLALTKLNLSSFLLATFLGSWPMVLQNVYVGSLMLEFAPGSVSSTGGLTRHIFTVVLIASSVLLSRYLYSYLKIVFEKEHAE
eukprot:TRINITY_DN11684_c0_g1_i1.p1 TRINITY_DN11684_c0_g1~~TRINITY_DN11684_c0_g1_i1.p1  ORF type:complete len:231 (+),score=18.97 TRINITY_DN11684_c0_g1_i1:30-722(+)